VPIRRMFYSGSGGNDIHLIRGQTSRDLRAASLAFIPLLPDGTDAPGAWAKDYLDAHTGAAEDVKLEFRPTFKAGLVGDEWTGLGIKVNHLTGVVSFETGAPPNPTANNFLIEAVITQNTGGPALATFNVKLIRVHVHPGVTRLRLTPSSMTVRRLTAAGADDTSYRFTVRAEFSDGTLGDITDKHGVSWSPAAYTRAVSGAQGWLRIPAGDAAGKVVPIKATWATSAGSFDATANMVVAAPWATDAAMPKAVLLDGHPDTWAGTINPNLVPNVLFFGDGFSTDPADQAAFEAIGNKIVHDLKTDPLTRPYDILATSMNYWRVAVPSAGRGVSIRCEVFTRSAAGKLFAKPVPPPLTPPAAGVWTIEHLLYTAGLPLPADTPPAGEAVAAASARRGALRARWASIARTSVVPAILSDAVIDQWALLGTRTFVDEIDAFPAMALGDPPQAEQDTDPPLLRLHTDRGGEVGLDAFYRALAASNNVRVTAPDDNLGLLWAEGRPTFRFDNRSLVVALAAYKGGRAQRTSRHIDIALESGTLWTQVIAGPVGTPTVSIDQTVALPAVVDVDVWRVIAHELGHSFGLNDEYAELPGVFNQPETSLDIWGNTTSEAAVKDGTAHFRVSMIKWNWRRVRKAAVLRAPIAPPAGLDFDLDVGLGQAFRFAVGDKVRLRERTFKKPLGLDPFECSSDLVVVSHNATGDVLTVHGSPSLLELALLPEGTVVYVPVPMPDGSPGEARMIAPKVASFIEDNNRPLTTWPCNPADHLGLDATGHLKGSLTQLPQFNVFSALWSHRNDARVVGLYEGGSQSGCGIFHPAGTCMMRNSHADKATFCAVCKFVMVDMINPVVHVDIDLDYDKSYPT
jgi:IgA Peptidase M64